jgi:hypothetical protein
MRFSKMANENIPSWKIAGDWCDVSKRNIPTPSMLISFPSYTDCEGVFVYKIRSGYYGQTTLDGLNILELTYFKRNMWSGNLQASIAIFLDNRAHRQQFDALQKIFSGKAGGFMTRFAKLIREHPGLNFVPISINIADDLSYWNAKLPEKIVTEIEALIGPQALSDYGLRAMSELGSEMALTEIATLGSTTTDVINSSEAGYKRIRKAIMSKHIAFEWSGP